MSDLDEILEDGEDDAPLTKAEKVGVGLFGCATIGIGLVGAVLGMGLGGLYHAFLAAEGGLLWHLALGGLLGFGLGVRTVLPLEELLVDFLFEGLPSLLCWRRQPTKSASQSGRIAP